MSAPYPYQLTGDGRPRPPKRVFTPSEREYIVAAYTVDRLTLSEICTYLRTGRDNVKRELDELHIPLRPPRVRATDAGAAPAHFTFEERRFIDSVGHGISVKVAAELARIPLQATDTIIARAKTFGEL